jgi:hypothetical protein
LEFDGHERRFYEDLLARGQETIEKMNEKGTLQNNYMCLLTMLLRLRQGMVFREMKTDLATDHIDLLKGKVDDDKDAINDTKPQDTNVSKEDADDLVNMMSGLAIETKCAVCMTL